MDYKDLFLSLIVVALAMSAYINLSTDINSSWGTNISTGFESDVEELRVGITDNLSSTSQSAEDRGSSELGASGGEGQEGIIQKSLRVIGTVPTLAGMPGKLIQTAGSKLGVAPWITDVLYWFFNFAFWLTFAYLLLMGVKSIF